MKLATPETFKSLRKELDCVCAAELQNCGPDMQKMAEERATALQSRPEDATDTDTTEVSKATAAIMAAIADVRKATPESFEDLSKRLDQVFSEELRHCGA